MRYIYLQKNAPYSLIHNWNNLNRGHRDWLTALPDSKKKTPKSNYNVVPSESNNSLSKYRFNGFQKSITDSLLENYSEKVKCNNSYCTDCN